VLEKNPGERGWLGHSERNGVASGAGGEAPGIGDLDGIQRERVTYTTGIRDPQGGGCAMGSVWRTGWGIPR
jgi:hypothetical protein